MNVMINNWQMYAFLSAFFAGMTAIFGKVGLQGIQSDLATLIRTVVIFFVTIFIVILKNEWSGIYKIGRPSYFFLILSGVATGASWICYYRALQMGPASKVAPIDKLSVVFAILFALIFLGEKLTLKAGAGAILIVSGVLLIAF